MAARWYARGVRPGGEGAADPAFGRWLQAAAAHGAAWRRLAEADRRLEEAAGAPLLDELRRLARDARPLPPPLLRRPV